MNRSSLFCFLVFVFLAQFFVAEDSFAVWSGQWYSKDPYPDYAPKGVPDFDQRSDMWGKVPEIRDPQDPRNNPENPEWQWTWDGPVAWANSIWWMDSRFESYFNPFPVPPPAISDSFPLVYSGDPAAFDDHDPKNVPLVIPVLGQFFLTDGQPWCSWSGTQVTDMIAGLRMGLDQLGLGKMSHTPPGPYFVVEAREYPAFYEIAREVMRCQDVILLLGLYEEDPTGAAPGEYARVGGHYVTVAAVNTAEKQLRLCDPFLDIANPAGGDHSDAAIVSHDPYAVADLTPKGCALTNYPWSLAVPGDPTWDALQMNFKGVNPVPLPAVFVTKPGLGYLTLVEYMIHLSPEWDTDLYQKPPYIDYAPLGLPDFDQRQDMWGKVPGAPSPGDPINNPQNPLWRWTWCGPVALANSLWWMDSKMEEIVLSEQGKPPIPPPEVSDHFPLLTAFGPWDDHAPNNAPPFVQDLAKRASADGAPWCSWLGTMPQDLHKATVGLLRERGLYFEASGQAPEDGIFLETGLTAHPAFEDVAREVYRCQDVILLLGFYEFTDRNEYVRIGGHYVTCAGVDRRGSRLKISDPILDDLLQPIDPLLHNDAGLVSHQEYHIATLSDGEFWLTDYPWSLGPQMSEWFYLLRENFEGANPSDLPPLDILHSCEYITKVEYMLHVSPVFWFWKGEGLDAQHDYAQAGVPDFSQKQSTWGKNPEAPGPSHPDNTPINPNWKWTWCGPVAVANSLWWLDSQFETFMTPVGAAPVKPPTVSDHFPLVEAYLAGVDDHHAANVTPFVQYLAKQMLTDGATWCQWQGTRIEDMVAGIKKYLDVKKLSSGASAYPFWFDVGLTKDPDLINQIAVELRRCQDVVLLLGFYRFEEGFYSRVGGHFVTVAGVNKRERLIGICDPWMDTVAGDNGPSGPGRFGIPHDPVPHAASQHNDADFISHDVYRVGLLSDGENFLVDYPWSDTGDPMVWERIEANFKGTNVPQEVVPIPDIQQVGRLLTKIEYMVHVSPVGKPVPVPVVVPQHAACGETVSFDGSGSYHNNPARSIVRYEWDFDGDGIYDAAGPVVSHAYPAFGTYHASLRVTDDDTPPVAAESFFDVFVDVGNHPPVADANGPYAIDQGQNLLLDGSGSYDPDGACGDSIVSYRWDLDNDGDFDDAIGEKPTVPWSVLEGFGLLLYPDTNPVALRVRDKLGLTDTDFTTLTIYDNRPFAVFTAAPNPAAVGEIVHFDGSGSYHGRPDRSIVRYEWDFDGDGAYDATGVTPTHVYNAAANYDAKLRVTDNNVPPKTATAVLTIRVSPAVPPEEIAVGLGAAGSGWFEILNGRNYILTHYLWKHVPGWLGETRPAMGDLDGDGKKEIVVGLGGGGSGGRLAVFDDRSTGYKFLRWIVIPWPAYNMRNGETWPAVGDIDGDGRNEIVVGLGPGSSGWFHTFNDAVAGYGSMGWTQVPWTWYDMRNGETRPAVGDLDGDRKDEVVIGLGRFPAAGGWLCIFDDGSFGLPLPFRGWRRVPYPAYNTANGETWPVTGDIDGDGREEIVVGLGPYPLNGGWMAFFEDPVTSGFMGWRRLPWPAYNRLNGETHPATANLDGDARAELVVGLGNGGRGYLWIADDWTTGVASKGWYWIPWGPYDLAQGLSYPRAKALSAESPEGADSSLQGDTAPPEPHPTLVGSISGNVSSGGSPLERAWVSAYSDAWTPLLSTMTDASGDYLIEGLDPGTYFVEVSTQGYQAAEYYDDVPGIPSARGSATPVSVYDALETAGIDFEIGPGGTISGKVTTDEPSPVPVVEATITAYVEGASWVAVAQTQTTGDGSYMLQGLAAGTYFLECSATTAELMSEYYDDVPATPPNQAIATPIPVAAGQSVLAKDFALGPGSTIIGQVTDESSGTPIEGVAIVLYMQGDDGWEIVDASFTSGIGEYGFGGLPPGTYYLEASYRQGGYAGEYYDNVGALVMNRPLATPVVLSEGDVATHTDFALAKGGSISGIVRPSPGVGVGLEGAAITVYEEGWVAIAGETTTDMDGKYSVGSLPAGNYYVSADGHGVGYCAEYYDNQPMTEEGKALATLITVSPGSVSASFDFDLAPLASISGTVQNRALPPSPIAYAMVEAIDPETEEPVASSMSAADGTYELLVEPGDYYVSAVAAGYARQYYDGASELADADLVSPAAGAPGTGIDFFLAEIGFIVVVSDVQSAPFTLSLALGPAPIVGNTGPDRIWESGELAVGEWTITWGDVPGYDKPSPETQTLGPGETLTFFGRYALAEGFRVNKVSKTLAADPEYFKIEWYAEIGKWYQVQGKDDLLTDSWQNLGPPLPGAGALMSYEELIAAKRMRYLRLQAL